MKAWVDRHPLSAFFAFAYGLSWAIGIPLALQARGVIPSRLPMWMHYFTAFGPAVAALLVATLRGEQLPVFAPPQPRRFAARARWWMIGLVSPVLLLVLAVLPGALINGTAPLWPHLGLVNFLPDLGWAAWLLWFLTSGCGEEIGWRGFALPRLQRQRSALSATLLLSLGWAGWHLPAFFYLPSYAAFGLRIIPGFVVGIAAGAIVLTWLFNSSGGSVLAVILWHASFNWVTASPTASGLPAAIVSALVIVWAVVLLWRTDWRTLTWDVVAQHPVPTTLAR